jgi:hypothetical protein
MQVRQFSMMAVLLVLLLLGACAGFPIFRGRPEPANDPTDAADRQTPSAQALLELQNIRYDGEYLSGRFLVGVSEGQLTIDRRLIEHVSVQVESVADCASHQPVGYVETDSFPQPATEQDLLTLTPGYWYGAQVRFFLLDEKVTGDKPPECIEVELALRAADRRVAAHLSIRAERSTQLPPDAGSPRTSFEDAGTPGIEGALRGQ